MRTSIAAVTFFLLTGTATGSLSAADAGTNTVDTPKPSGQPLILEPVVVTAPRIPTPLTSVPAAVSVVEKEEIQPGRPAVTLNESLVSVPGVFTQNRYNFAQGLRIAIRGFGARSAFGVRGIRVIQDGIPLTLPDGQTQIDGIDPASLERIEIMRGPASSLYGNSSGGVVNIVTEEGPSTPSLGTRTVNGEFGLWKMTAKGGGEYGRINYFAALSYLEDDGFRDHSRTEQTTFTSKIRYDLDQASDLTLLLTIFDSPVNDDPGGLTAEQVHEDREQASPLSQEYKSGEDISQTRIGLVYRRSLTPGCNLQLTGYYGHRDLDNAVPFRFVNLERDFFGSGVQFSSADTLWAWPSLLMLGIDGEYQDDDRVNFDNAAGEPIEPLLLGQDERVTSIGPYIQEEITPWKDLSFFFGGRYDYVRFSVDDRLTTDSDDSGDRTFNQFTSRFGVLYNPSQGLNAYATISQSFETPTTTELANQPDESGGINRDIDPQQAINYEVGAKGEIGRRLVYELALFYIDLSDELIAFRSETDEVFYRNAGESSRIGLELATDLVLFPGLTARCAYTYLDAEFDDYLKDGQDLAGNRVPGLPEHQVFAGLEYQNPCGFSAGVDLFWVSDFYANDENTVENDSYTVTEVRAGYEAAIGRWLLSPFFGIDNLFDEEYNSNVRINANGGRYFEPAPGRNIYGGIGLAYSW